MIAIGLVYTFIYFIVFRFLILKFDYKTPGRDSDAAIKFYTKEQYKEKKEMDKEVASADKRAGMEVEEETLEEKILFLVGGRENIIDVTNCATRLRLNVKSGAKVASDKDFKAIGTHGAKITGDSVQVIIGLDVPNVREKFEALL